MKFIDALTRLIEYPDLYYIYKKQNNHIKKLYIKNKQLYPYMTDVFLGRTVPTSLALVIGNVESKDWQVEYLPDNEEENS